MKKTAIAAVILFSFNAFCLFVFLPPMITEGMPSFLAASLGTLLLVIAVGSACDAYALSYLWQSGSSPQSFTDHGREIQVGKRETAINNEQDTCRDEYGKNENVVLN